MTNQTDETLVETLGVVDANAQLLLAKSRAASLKSRQLEASLALLVGLLANSPDLEGGQLVHQISGQLRFCAHAPDMAAQVVGCDPELISPAILLAAAQVLTGGETASTRAASPVQPLH